MPETAAPAHPPHTRSAPPAARCVVRVPASTSNLGAGFDCVGVAVDRWLTVQATLRGDGPPLITRAGTLASLDLTPERDLIVRGFAAACERAGGALPAVALEAHSTIPVGRGLGSSAAACVAGALAANRLLDLGLNEESIVNVAAAIEGHPDNVAPATYGGAVLGVRATDTSTAAWHVRALPVHPSLRLVFAIPNFEVATCAARSVLPREVGFAVAVDAAARAAALVAGLASADATLLRAGFDDVLHVPHRRTLVRGYGAVAAAAVSTGALGATLSGSGSSLVAIALEPRASAVATAMCDAWRRLGVCAEALVSAGRVPGAIVEAALS